MARRVFTRAFIEDVKAYKQNHTSRETAKYFQISRGSVNNILYDRIEPVDDRIADCETITENKEAFETELRDDSGTLKIDVSHPKDEAPRWLDIKNPEELLKHCKIDTNEWEVDSCRVSSSEVTMRLRKYKNGKQVSNVPKTYTNVHVSVRLKRKKAQVRALESLIAEIKNARPIFLVNPPVRKQTSLPKRHLEIDILDPHIGLRCFEPAADKSWTPEQATDLVLEMVDKLLDSAKSYGPFEGIVWPFGNDFLHADNVFHTTTQGTAQPESDAWQHVYQIGYKLCLTIVEKLRKAGKKVYIYSVPGNHDRQSVFTLAQLLDAVFAKDDNVIVDASSSPYKFHRYGVNLIGFEHGHSIRQTVRLAALMANECRDVWGETCYREWHLGDQHRKGSSKPSMFEEQGVSVEFLAGLTPPNEWHRLKSFNWQKRAATAFVWDYDSGPVARLQVNINNQTGKIMDR